MWIQNRPIAPVRKPTKLSDRRQMQQVLYRERARADRTGTPFAMVLFQSRAAGRSRAADDRQTMRLARAVSRRVRLIDDVGWFSDDVLGAILHDCDLAGARRFVDDVRSCRLDTVPDFTCRIDVYPDAGDDVEAFTGSSVEPIHRGNGNGNGNGHGSGNAEGEALSAPRRRTAHATADVLMPFVMQGFVSETSRVRPTTREIGHQVGHVRELLVRAIPAWKRAMDLSVASLLLAVLWPGMCLIALAVRLTSPGPAIFRQRRTGLAGRPFTLYKFRTMVVDAEMRKSALRKFSEQDGPAFKMTHDPRVTPLGRFLRSSSLDELPQLWNVIKGDMSLVGPRPLPVSEAQACAQWHRQRVDVTPGITCIWQVKGRSRVSFTEWVRMDLSYLRNRGLLNDLVILFQTIPAVLKRRGAR